MCDECAMSVRFPLVRTFSSCVLTLVLFASFSHRLSFNNYGLIAIYLDLSLREDQSRMSKRISTVKTNLYSSSFSMKFSRNTSEP